MQLAQDGDLVHIASATLERSEVFLLKTVNGRLHDVRLTFFIHWRWGLYWWACVL